jgi:hypothetical protein
MTDQPADKFVNWNPQTLAQWRNELPDFFRANMTFDRYRAPYPNEMLVLLDRIAELEAALRNLVRTQRNPEHCNLKEWLEALLNAEKVIIRETTN